MKYKKKQRRNPQKPDEEGKYYAAPASSGKITINELSSRIERNSSLSQGDILNVLSNFLDELPEYLKDGKSVRLGDFGTFRCSFSSEGADTPEQVNPNLIKTVRVIFTPSTKLKHRLSDITFEEQK
jgi:predicted histone-like DNA-binding protein